MRKIITISGLAGSGKSTIAKELAKKLNYQIISTGQFVREMVKNEFNDDLYEFEKICEKKPEIDKKIDSDILQKVENITENLICDWRLGFHFLPNSFKIYVTCQESVVVQRTRIRDEDLKNLSDDDILKKNNLRNNSSVQRFIQFYGVDYSNLNNYDLVVDNSSELSNTIENIMNSEIFLNFLNK